ncbi:MAG TPA: peptidase M61 [Parafilimonas sp.]|nr:peptidase M61 [Parafilimonas sp.]
MIKYFQLPVLLLLLHTLSYAQTNNAYKFKIDLVNVSDDKVRVELTTPAIKSNTITYHVPKIVPGTYSEDDYGRYIAQFKALDKNGKELSVTQSDLNSWSIADAGKLYKISYLVNDTYDSLDAKPAIFEPAGSNIQKDTNYVINNHCFLGYFDDMKNVQYEITIQHPANMYGSTALTDMDNSNTSDKFITESYNRIVDNPFMYDVPDTTTIKVGNTNVLISLYSPNKKVSSKFLAEKLDTLLQAQGKYLGGKLPVDKYAFIIYLNDKRGPSGAEGALEHSYCSMYYYPERSAAQLSAEFVDHAAHEFFHIITPLTIHSEEIQFFDFNHPKMSQHLWLYEGSTEYHAQMVQVKYGLITPEQLLNRISGKITQSRNNYNDTVPFTKMSSQVLGQYKNQFGNVYQKGALITMCLDIKLLQLSNGNYGILNLIRDLSNKYGKQKGFKDDELFGEITKLTYPEIGEFLNTYVGGNQPLPLKEVLDLVGVTFKDEEETKDSAFSMGKVSFTASNGKLAIADTSQINSLGRSMGYHPGDEIVSVNGEEVSLAKASSLFKNFGASSKPGDSLIVNVMRKNENGESMPVTLRGVMTKFPIIKYNVLGFSGAPTQEQLKLRDAWLKPRAGVNQ